MLLQQIDQDLKIAQKERNDLTVSALRNLKAALKNAQIAAQTLSGRASPTPASTRVERGEEGGREKQQPLSEDEVLGVIARQVKQHQDSIESFKSGNRPDLVQHEQAQMAVLEKFLPKQMDEEHIHSLILAVIADLSAKPSDFGKVMKEVLSRARGQTNGTIVSKIVQEELK
jgi:uncharacterized protein YqeY